MESGVSSLDGGDLVVRGCSIFHFLFFTSFLVDKIEGGIGERESKGFRRFEWGFPWGSEGGLSAFWKRIMRFGAGWAV